MLDATYWENHYRGEDTPWDIGSVSPALKAYIDGIQDKNLRILIPGAGSAHEAIYLHRAGFTRVFVCDWAPSAFQYLRKEAPDFPEGHLLVADFFKLELEVDLILEQTFFCAIQPELRKAYALKTAELLAAGGKLAGLLFAFPFDAEGPPFGGTRDEYEHLFAPHFQMLHLAISNLSIKPRAGRELFIELLKR
ncbi:MAG: SAM-dependent methyltransferase [Saprospiraceae bacterium]|nr:SAM-dependent methyltransferase [Saprospiraceae bacterium]